MKQFRILLAPALWVAMALPGAAGELSLNQLSTYLNGLATAEASFTQYNEDRSKNTGKLFIKRPGRIRFEYDPPEATLVLASGGAVAIYDPKSNQGPETYPLRKTPLWIVLEKNVNLAQARMVVGHSYDGKATKVTAQDPEHPEYGTIEMLFTDAPVALREWVINSESGSRTRVVLGPMKVGRDLRDSIFNIQLQTEDKDRR